MNNPEFDSLTPELIVRKRQLVVRRPMGLMAVRDAIATTFRMADEYAHANRELIGYNISEFPNELQIAHRDKDTNELTKFGIFADTEDVHSVEVLIHRGTPARHPDVTLYDSYILSRLGGNAAGLSHLTNGAYETQLIEQDDEGEYAFAKGIGPKRQERSGKVLQIMQDRVRRLQGRE